MTFGPGQRHRDHRLLLLGYLAEDLIEQKRFEELKSIYLGK